MDAQTSGKAPRELTHPNRTFGIAMLVYLLLVHGVNLFIPTVSVTSAAPAAFSGWVDVIPGLSQPSEETSILAFRIVNLLLLYLLMYSIYSYTRHTIRGPIWLGSLTATMLMANPALREVVLGVDGARYLLPAMLLMSALAVYAFNARQCWIWCYAAALVLGGMAIFAAPANLCAPLLFLLHEWLAVSKEERNWRRPMPFFVLGIIAVILGSFSFSSIVEAPAYLIPPLHFVLYPIGLLPETAAWYEAHPAAAWGSIAFELALVVSLLWVVRHRIMILGVAGAFIAGWTWCAAPVNPVSLVGSNQLLLPAVFCMVAFAGLCDAVWQHPKWRRPVVLLTALLCFLLFVMQWQTSWASYKDAGPQANSDSKAGTMLPLERDEDKPDAPEA